jgi:hypothetical protein
MELFVVRTRCHQIELDPSADEETRRLRAYLTRYPAAAEPE